MYIAWWIEMFLCFFYVLFVPTLAVSLQQQEMSCTDIPAPNGEVFDLSPLVGKTVSTSDGFSEYKASICKNVWQCGGCNPGGYCLTNEFWSDCIGVYGKVKALVTEVGVELLYTGGDFGWTGIIELICVEGGSEISNCRGSQSNRKITCYSPHACPGLPKTLSLGSTFLVILFVLVVGYLIVGILWNKYRNGKEGLDLVPHLEFWRESPGLAKDGIQYTYAKAKELIAKWRG